MAAPAPTSALEPWGIVSSAGGGEPGPTRVHLVAPRDAVVAQSAENASRLVEDDAEEDGKLTGGLLLEPGVVSGKTKDALTGL
jgi:hypothetical protein